MFRHFLLHYFHKREHMQPPSQNQQLPTLTAFLFAISSVVVVWLPVLWLHLTLVLFALLIVYALTRGIANRVRQQTDKYLPKISPFLHVKQRAEWVSIVLIVSLISIGTYYFGDWVAEKADINRFYGLLQQLILIFDQLQKMLPYSIAKYLPESAHAIQEFLLNTAKTYAPQLQLMGIHTLRGVGYVVIGGVIGGILALQLPHEAQTHQKPLTQYFRQKFDELVAGFSDVFFAQVKISAINTVLTSIYLLGILPAIGHPLPMPYTVVLITFLAGLFPVVGNLVSNVVIVALSLTHGLMISIASLLWLVSIHKLEYFLNAQIIGNRIRATAWELLIFMLILESVFGIAGLISAPIIYAQVKRILTNRGWV